MERVTDVMTAVVDAASPADSLTRVAHVLWERDCGVVPVLDVDGRPLGMLTDRDACMASFMSGRPLHEIAVSDVLPEREVVTIAADASLDAAHELMRVHQVRRLPVVDAAGVCVGVLSLADLAQVPGGKASAADRRRRAEAVGTTLTAVVRPHHTPLVAALPTSAAKASGGKRAAPKKAASSGTAKQGGSAKASGARGKPALGRGLGKGQSAGG
ncbi:MAG: CBS domain-containing protein [Planctomycetes bacterium]|nr:CBS domain-containing protein [Planctomycetota bacterium]